MVNNEKSTFDKLFAINVNEYTEKKNGLTYLSWAYAWAEVKKLYPNATVLVLKEPKHHGEELEKLNTL